jgi:glycosyltransferase involved in cell wall biosynthesis
VLASQLDFGEERLLYVPFGVDQDGFAPTRDPEADHILVVGRDQGRDWPTTFEALGNIGMRVKVCCRPADLRGLRVPGDIDVVGYVDRSTYRALLGTARTVVVATRPLLYPSGQTVLLEAMAMKRAVVVTGTPALSDYIEDGVTAVSVPPGDPAALREQVLRVAGDERLRRSLGEAGRTAVERTFNARSMWKSIGNDLRELVDT